MYNIIAHIMLPLICFHAGTFDVYNVTVTSLLTGAVCFTVHYFEGHTTNQSFVKLTCPLTQNCLIQTVKENGCFVNLPPCSYTLSATDADVDSNNTVPAVSIKELIVPGLDCTRIKELIVPGLRN